MTAEPDDGSRMVCVGVHDQGPGLDPIRRAGLFTTFHHAGNARKKGQGLGLGLYLCRELVAQHGGRIWVESLAPHGTCFFFSLPTVTAARESQTP